MLLLLGLPTAAQVIQQSQKAYDAVKTFEQDATGDIDGAKGTAHISFSRPGRMRVSGTSLFGFKYDMLSDGKSTWVFNGAWKAVPSPELGIASITGISAGAGNLVPGALLVGGRGGLEVRAMGKSTVVAETVKGKKLLRIHATEPFESSTWIDAGSHFVVRTETIFGGKKMVVVFGPPKVNGPIPATRFKK